MQKRRLHLLCRKETFFFQTLFFAVALLNGINVIAVKVIIGRMARFLGHYICMFEYLIRIVRG